MPDFAFLLLTSALAVATWGLVVLCRKLGERK